MAYHLGIVHDNSAGTSATKYKYEMNKYLINYRRNNGDATDIVLEALERRGIQPSPLFITAYLHPRPPIAPLRLRLLKTCTYTMSIAAKGTLRIAFLMATLLRPLETNLQLQG